MNVDEFIEKYRLWIGGGLLVLILAGCAILLYRENYSKVSAEDKIGLLESRIERLENMIATLNDKIPMSNDKSNSNTQNSNEQNGTQITQPDSGQAAGANSQSNEIPKQVRNDTKVTGKVNINTASESQLDSLPGIGPTYAKRIIDYRNSKGGFKSIDEIKNVKGIGDKTFEKFKDQISI